MDLVFLQLKRDLRAGRGLFALWAGLLILYVVAAVSWLSRTAVPAAEDQPWSVAVALSAAWWIAGILAAWCILRDPPANANAFWRARPLGWTDLVAAKLILILGGLVLPLTLSHGMVLLALGAGSWWPACLVDAVQTQWWWIFGAAALAALGGSWRHMLSIVLGGWVAGTGAFVVLDGLSRMGIGLNQYAIAQLVLAAGAMLPSGWTPVIAATVLVLQYAWRRPVRTAGAALALTMGGMLLMTRAPAPPLDPAGLPGFTVSIHGNRQLWTKGPLLGSNHEPQADSATRELSGILAALDLAQPSAPYFVRPQSFTDSRVRYPDQTVPVTGHIRWEDNDTPALRTFQSAVPGMSILNPNPASMPHPLYVTLVDFAAMDVTLVEKSLFGGETVIRRGLRPQEFAGREGIFEGHLRFVVGRHEPVVELPLEHGATWEDGPNRITVNTRHLRDTTNSLLLRLRWVKLEHARSLDPVHCLLVNRERREAYVPVRTRMWVAGYQRVYPFAVQDLRINYWNRQPGEDIVSHVIGDDWLDGASILVVTRPTVGQVTKSLRLEGFRLWPDPGELKEE